MYLTLSSSFSTVHFITFCWRSAAGQQSNFEPYTASARLWFGVSERTCGRCMSRGIRNAYCWVASEVVARREPPVASRLCGEATLAATGSQLQVAHSGVEPHNQDAALQRATHLHMCCSVAAMTFEFSPSPIHKAIDSC